MNIIHNMALEHIGGYNSPETPIDESQKHVDFEKNQSNISVMNINEPRVGS